MHYLRKYWSSIFVISIILIFSIGSLFIDLKTFQLYVEGAGIWAPFLYILLKSSTVIFAPLSGTALYIFSVPIFGFWWAILYSFIGDLIGAVVTFYIARIYGKPIVAYFIGRKNLKYVYAALDIMSTPKGFLSLRFATITTPEIASYSAGLSTLPFKKFIFIHMLIDSIPTLTLSFFGLLFTEKIPLAITITIATVAIIVTGVSTYVFIRMVKKHSDSQLTH